MFTVVYLHSCLLCRSPVDTASGPVCDVHVSVGMNSPALSETLTISLPPLPFFLSIWFLLFFLSILCWKAVAWWWLYGFILNSCFSVSPCLSFYLLYGLWGVCGEKPLETLSGSITVLRSVCSWLHAEISDRYWDFLLPLCMHISIYPETHPVSDIRTYSTAGSRLCTHIDKQGKTVFLHISVSSTVPDLPCLLNEVAHSTHLVSFWFVRTHFRPLYEQLSLTER